MGNTKPARKRNQGSHWIRPEKRLAIYLRDGLACAYCGATIEDGARLTLDHLRPVSRGGSNEASNLVTCCCKCNSSRGNRPVAAFTRAVAEYVDADAKEIERHVRRQSKRSLAPHIVEAKEMIERRGSVARAIEAM